jgi:UDP-N-acetylglucosamine 2-epimerase (non-hydrolysing)
MIDSLRHFLPIAPESRIGHELELRQSHDWRRFALLTPHRPSNVDVLDTLAGLPRAIDAVAVKLPVIFPVHPRTRQWLAQAGRVHHPRLHLTPPIGYLDLLCLLSKATLALTDSGGIQEETAALGAPSLTLRENAERLVTICKGTNLLVGTAPRKIPAIAYDILEGRSKAGRVPPLWAARPPSVSSRSSCGFIPGASEG